MTVPAYLLAELLAWKSTRRPLASVAGAVPLALAASLTWLAPAALSALLPALALVFGWLSGSRYRADSRFRQLLLGSGLGPADAAIGRACLSLIEALFHALLYCPLVLLCLAMWGKGSEAALAVFLSFVANFLLAASLAFPASLLLGGTGHLPGLWLCLAYLSASSLIGALRPFSPVTQVWRALSSDPRLLAGAVLAASAELGLSAAAFIAAVPAVAWARRRDARS